MRLGGGGAIRSLLTPALISTGFPNLIVGDPNGRPVIIQTSPSVIMAYSDANGIPQQVTLIPSGSLSSSVPVTYDSLDIAGTVSFSAGAAGSILKRCRVTSPDATATVFGGFSTGNITVQDCIIDGTPSNVNGSNGLWCQGTILRNHILNAENPLTLTDASLIQDNYINNPLLVGGGHPDTIQMDGINNVILRHNTVLCELGGVSCLQNNNQNDLGGCLTITSLIVDNNLIRMFPGGSGTPLYLDTQFGSCTISGVSYTNNVIQAGTAGQYLFKRVTNAPSYTKSGNTDYNTGANIDGLL